MSDSSNAEVTLTLAPPSAGGTSTDVPPSRRRPPAVFVDHSVQGSRQKIHICIADGRCLRKIEVECGNDEDEDKDKDDDPTSLLAPLLDYNGGECGERPVRHDRPHVLPLSLSLSLALPA